MLFRNCKDCFTPLSSVIEVHGLASQDKSELRKIIFAQTARAMHSHVYPMTISLFDLEDNSVSSGTLVNVFGHFFIATAAHCVPSSPNGRLCAVADRPRKFEQGCLEYTRIGRNIDLDVAFLEVEPKAFGAYYSEKQPCRAERLLPSGTPKDPALVLLAGSVAETVKVTTHKGSQAIVPQIEAFATQTIPRSRWPRVPPASRRSDRYADVFIEYPPTGIRLDSLAATKTWNPMGFSGGGIWYVEQRARGTWTPELAKLVAIQASYCANQQYLRGTQIVAWLRLICSECKDLKKRLMRRFPEIGDSQATHRKKRHR